MDPVGACVGARGSRVQNVVDALSNEKIDIIQYTADTKNFIAAALAPAENIQIDLNEELKQATITVPDDQLSLAIGKGGQNVRLAAKLSGYKLDIQGTSGEKIIINDEENPSVTSLALPERTKTALIDAGITTLDELKAKREELNTIKGVGPKAVESINSLLDQTKS